MTIEPKSDVIREKWAIFKILPKAKYAGINVGLGMFTHNIVHTFEKGVINVFFETQTLQNHKSISPSLSLDN